MNNATDKKQDFWFISMLNEMSLEKEKEGFDIIGIYKNGDSVLLVDRKNQEKSIRTHT